MFFAAVVCCIAAVLSLYTRIIAFIFITISLLLLAVAIFYKKYKYIVIVLAIILFAISLLQQFFQINKINNFNNKNVYGNFLVASDPEAYDDFNQITLKLVNSDSLPKNSKYLVFDYKKTKLKMGDIITANIKLSAINRYNEYRLYDYGNGIYATAGINEIKKTGNNPFYKTAGNVRRYLKNTISYIFDGDIEGLLLALTTGDKSLLSEDFSENVKTTGISHIIVVSGMHLSIIMTAVFWLLDRFFYNKYIRSFLSICIVAFIFAVCGFTMSITRAGAMFIVAGLAPVFNRESDSLSSLFTAITAVLICAPFAIVNISFLLSVLATLAIIWVVPFYYRLIIQRFNITSKIIKSALNISLCSVFAIIFTLPVTIKIFGFVSVVSPLTNLLITYPITVVLIMNIIALSLYAVPFIKIFGHIIFFIVGYCTKYITFIVNQIAKIPITVAVLPKNSFWLSVLIIFAFIGYMYYYEFKKKRSDLIANNI